LQFRKCSCETIIACPAYVRVTATKAEVSFFPSLSFQSTDL